MRPFLERDEKGRRQLVSGWEKEKVKVDKTAGSPGPPKGKLPGNPDGGGVEFVELRFHFQRGKGK